MPNAYPYMISNNKISSILSKIQSAAKPPKFTHDFLKKMGFVSSNDRAAIALLKSLGFLTGDGTPTAHYDRLKDSTQHASTLGERIRALYSDLFQINTHIYRAPDAEIKGAFARITGKDETSVNRYFATFKALVPLAKFDTKEETEEPKDGPGDKEEKPIDEKDTGPKKNDRSVELPKNGIYPDFHYNIQIHLPATNDVSVYNAIFKSLKDNLLI